MLGFCKNPILKAQKTNELKMKFNISLVSSIRDNYPIDISITYDELVEKLTTFPDTIKTKFDNSGFIGGQFGQKRRTTENLISRTLITLDLDHYNSDLTSLEGVLKRDLSYQWYIAYSTASHTPERPKIRIVILLTKDIPTESYNTVVTNFVDGLELQPYLDENKASEKPNQLMYLPTRTHEGYKPWFQVNKGELLNPDYYIVDYGIKTTNSVLLGFQNAAPKKINLLDKKVDNVLIQIVNQPLQITESKIKSTLEIYKAEDCNYDQWLEVGMALSHQFSGQKQGAQIWWDWCKNNPKFTQDEIKKNIEKKWKSFGESNNPKRFATIMKKAKVNEVVEFKKKVKATGGDDSGIENNVPRHKFLHKVGEANKPLSTIENFKILLDEYNINIKLDVILKLKEVSFDGVVEKDLNTAQSKIESLCIQNILPYSQVSKYMDVVKQEVNSWRDWIESKPWDGVDRLEAFCDTVEVAAELNSTKNAYIKTWLMQMLHLSCLNDADEGKMGRMVLVFQGSQRIGKTSWFKSLCPKTHQKYLKEGMILDTKDSMSVLACIQHVFVELGELGSTFKKSDADNLKNFISSTSDVINVKYVANHVVHRRRTVFFASINDQVFLSDTTGNSRYLILPVKKCDYKHGINMQQLYAQLYAAAKAGEGYELTNELLEVQKNLNAEFENESYLQQKFLDIFNADLECTENWLSIPQVLHHLGFLPPAANKQSNMTEMARVLKNLGYIRRANAPRRWKLPPLR